jgi:ABC-2 type transport system ATP-binding protein
MTQEAISISVRGLTHAYGALKVLDTIELRVRRGEFFGFLGQNGAGKSTAIRALCGFLQPGQGEIEVAGVNVIRNPSELRRHIGILSEDIALYDRLSGTEFLEFAGQMHGLSAADAHRRSEDLLERLELQEACARPIGGYSLGMRKKTAFAAALIHSPQVLFLDEPFNGVDAASTRTLCAMLKWLSSEKGVTIFFTSHVLEMAERLCDRIAILHNGRIVQEGTPAELKQDAMAHGATLEEIFLSLTGAKPRADAALTWF